jgi:hypothetical protein
MLSMLFYEGDESESGAVMSRQGSHFLTMFFLHLLVANKDSTYIEHTRTIVH